MAENLVKFVYATAAQFDTLAQKDNNTIYFIKDGDLYKIYKGATLYDGTSPSVAADLATLESYIGTLPVDEAYTDLIDFIEKSDATVASNAQDALDTLDAALADVAKSGNAEDVAIADKDGLITATNVEGALAELATAISTNDAAAEVTMESASGSGDVLTVYDFYQGVLQSDDAAAKAAKKIGTINIPKDYLVRSANIETVSTADEPYAGAAVGDKYIDFVVNTKDGQGTGTATHMYIALNDLVAVMQGSVGSEITVAIGANNTISATVNEISGDKVIYAVGTGGAEDVTVNAKIAALEEALGDGLAALDADVDAAAVPASGYDTYAVGVVSGVTEVNGVITAVDTTYVDAAGSAMAVKNAVIGTSGDLASADTINGAKAYADGLVNALDADLDATTANTDVYAVAVVTGVTEANGVITGIDSAAADAAGAATAVKSEVIGASTDLKTADTINGAKAYADDAVATALTWGSISNS